MFSLEDLDLQFDSEHEPNFEQLPVKSSTANVFRKPSRLENGININTARSTNTDQSSNVERPKAVRRKFPGPAGLLPDKPPRSFIDSSLILENLENELEMRRDEPVFCSQASESIFNEPQFKKLSSDFGLNELDSPLTAFTVDWVKKKALGKGLKSRKIPFLAVMLQSIDCTSADPLVILRDPTGELFGALDRETYKEMSYQLQPGVAIVLKEVGVLSTGVTRRQVILNMTKNNILSIYSSTEEGEVITDTVQSTTKTEILRNVADWQARAQNSSPKPPPVTRNNLFVQAASTPKGIIYQNKSKPFRPPFLQNAQLESNFELFSDDIDFSSIDEQATKKPKTNQNSDTQTILSQAETSMLDEVLNGVDLDDF